MIINIIIPVEVSEEDADTEEGLIDFVRDLATLWFPQYVYRVEKESK